MRKRQDKGTHVKTGRRDKDINEGGKRGKTDKKNEEKLE
jgi:hypothetical protein